MDIKHEVMDRIAIICMVQFRAYITIPHAGMSFGQGWIGSGAYLMPACALRESEQVTNDCQPK